jgi:hypothetical protein
MHKRKYDRRPSDSDQEIAGEKRVEGWRIGETEQEAAEENESASDATTNFGTKPI